MCLLEDSVRNSLPYSSIIFSDLPQSYYRDVLNYIAPATQSTLFSVYKLCVRGAPGAIPLH